MRNEPLVMSGSAPTNSLSSCMGPLGTFADFTVTGSLTAIALTSKKQSCLNFKSQFSCLKDFHQFSESGILNCK